MTAEEQEHDGNGAVNHASNDKDEEEAEKQEQGGPMDVAAAREEEEDDEDIDDHLFYKQKPLSTLTYRDLKAASKEYGFKPPDNKKETLMIYLRCKLQGIEPSQFLAASTPTSTPKGRRQPNTTAESGSEDISAAGSKRKAPARTQQAVSVSLMHDEVFRML